MTTYLGTIGNDVFGAHETDDVYWTFMGADTITTGGGTDAVFAGFGADTINIGSGVASVRGGFGADVFVFQSGATGLTTIRDFESGQDKIDLSALGVTGLDDVQILPHASGRGSYLTVGGETISLKLTPNELVASDFIFAPAPIREAESFEADWLVDLTQAPSERSSRFDDPWDGADGLLDADDASMAPLAMILDDSPFSG